MEGKYSIELFRDGGEGASIEKILVRHDSLTAARVLYKAVVLNYAERLIMLCDKARLRLLRSFAPHRAKVRALAGCTPGAALTCFNYTWGTVARFRVSRESFLLCEQ